MMRRVLILMVLGSGSEALRNQSATHAATGRQAKLENELDAIMQRVAEIKKELKKDVHANGTQQVGNVTRELADVGTDVYNVDNEIVKSEEATPAEEEPTSQPVTSHEIKEKEDHLEKEMETLKWKAEKEQGMANVSGTHVKKVKVKMAVRRKARLPTHIEAAANAMAASRAKRQQEHKAKEQSAKQDHKKLPNMKTSEGFHAKVQAVVDAFAPAKKSDNNAEGVVDIFAPEGKGQVAKAAAPQKEGWRGPMFPAPENATAIAKAKKAQMKKEYKQFKTQQKLVKRHKVGHQLAQHARHAKYHQFELEPMEVRTAGQCGERIRASSLGLKRSAATSWIWQNPALLQEPEGPTVSLAKPGAGSVQVKADHGRSLHGSVNTDEGTMEEPFVRVFKDGYFEVGCIKDLMYETADKYHYNKFKFIDDVTNVSIVHYKAVVMDSEWKPMTRTVCFEFCRTIPDMVFFGLTEGRECYCTPYYKTPMMQPKDDKCDKVCEGDNTEMCGGDRKTTVFEMHLCADFLEAIKESAMVADEMLSYMYDTAFIASSVADNLLAAGKKLKDVSQSIGLPKIADYGYFAEQCGTDLRQSIVKMDCLDSYRQLMATYKEAKDLRSLDFTRAENLQKSDDARAAMKDLSMDMAICTKKIEEELVLSYPFYHEFAELKNLNDYKNMWGTYTAAFEQYYPLLYVISKVSGPKMTTCEGEKVLKATTMTMAECSEACDKTVYPDKCIGFQYYQMGSSKEFMPLCFLFKKFTQITTFECPFVDEFELLQKKNVVHKQALRGNMSKQDPPICESTKQSVLYSGLTCNEFFPTDSPYPDTCPESCTRTEGALMSAMCMVKLSESTGISQGVRLNRVGRCFGKEANKAIDQSGSSPHTIPTDVGDDGPEMEGDFEVGTYGTMEDPMNHIWTRD